MASTLSTCTALALAIACLPAAAQDFKGIKLGATQEEARQAAVEFTRSWSCQLDLAVEQRMMCVAQGLTYAGVDAELASLYFDADRLTIVVVSLPSSGFQSAADALTARHGKPRKVERSKVQNGFGATFDQIMMEWRPAPTTVVSLHRYGRDTKTSNVIIGTLKAVLATESDSSKKKARGDI